MTTLVNILLFQHNIYLGDNTKQLQASSTQPIVAKPQEQPKAVQKMSAEELVKDVPPDKLAVQLTAVAIEGLMDEELSDSGGEGMYRERDEFVVRNEDIERMEVCWDVLFVPFIYKSQHEINTYMLLVLLCTIYSEQTNKKANRTLNSVQTRESLAQIFYFINCMKQNGSSEKS